MDAQSNLSDLGMQTRRAPPLAGSPQTQHTPGQTVTLSNHYGRSVRAILMRHEPYRHSRGQHVTDGWYVSYPDATEQWHCHGGWIPTSSIDGAALSQAAPQSEAPRV